jgi:hypothetical protein
VGEIIFLFGENVIGKKGMGKVEDSNLRTPEGFFSG